MHTSRNAIVTCRSKRPERFALLWLLLTVSPCVHAQPTHAQPTHAQPARTQPTRAQPTHAQPTRAQPTRAQPTRFQSQTSSQKGDSRVKQVDPANRKKARQLFRQAKKLVQAKKFKHAARLFEKAYLIWPRKEIQFNLALVYLGMDQKIKAATHLQHYLRRASTAQRQQLPRFFKKLLQEVGVLTVHTVSATDTVWVDGKIVGQHQAEIVLSPGTHQVVVRAGNKVIKRRSFQVRGGHHIFWKLDRGAPQSKPLPTARQPSKNSPSIKHTKRLKSASVGLHWGYFTAAAVLFAASGATLAALGTKTLLLEKDYEKDPSLSLRAKGRNYKTASNVMAGVTAAAGAALVVIGIFTRWRKNHNRLKDQTPPKNRPMNLSIHPSPQGGMLTFAAEF